MIGGAFQCENFDFLVLGDTEQICIKALAKMFGDRIRASLGAEYAMK
jgi:hypothetical protein